MARFLNIKDKIEVSRLDEKLYCPAHCWPHQSPFAKPVTDEPCHYHHSLWRMSHHTPFCYLIGCKNYQRMMEKYKADKAKKKS